MRTLARNMAFLMESITLGKEEYGLPEKRGLCTDELRSVTDCMKMIRKIKILIDVLMTGTLGFT